MTIIQADLDSQDIPNDMVREQVEKKFENIKISFD